MVDGLRVVIVGVVAAVIVKMELLDAVPFALTDTRAEPVEPICFAATAAVNWVALTKVVGNGDPVHKTVDPAVNPEPFTVSVKAAPPACAAAGLRLLMVGVPPPPADEIVKLAALDVVPFVLTATLAAPAVAMKVALTEAVS